MTVVAMKYFMFLDDSGQLHPNYPLGDFFVYGGLLVSEKDFHGVNFSYKNLVKKIKKEKNIQGELKTTDMDIPTRRRLLKRLSKYTCHQIFVSAKVSSFVRLNFDSKRDIVRYKNYMLKRLIELLIRNSKLPKDCNFLEIHIDNQNIADKIGVSYRQLASYIAGEHYPPVPKLFFLAKLLGCQVDDLYEWIEEKKPTHGE